MPHAEYTNGPSQSISTRERRWSQLYKNWGQVEGQLACWKKLEDITPLIWEAFSVVQMHLRGIWRKVFQFGPVDLPKDLGELLQSGWMRACMDYKNVKLIRCQKQKTKYKKYRMQKIQCIFVSMLFNSPAHWLRLHALLCVSTGVHCCLLMAGERATR